MPPGPETESVPAPSCVRTSGTACVQLPSRPPGFRPIAFSRPISHATVFVSPAVPGARPVKAGAASTLTSADSRTGETPGGAADADADADADAASIVAAPANMEIERIIGRLPGIDMDCALNVATRANVPPTAWGQPSVKDIRAGSPAWGTFVTTNIPTLINGHDAIARSARLLLVMMADDGALASRAPGRLASLAVTVAMHAAQECGFVYAAESSADGTTTASFAAEQARLDRDWTAYLAAWPRQRIRRETQGFREESQAILSRLLDRIDRENSYLYPHALAINALAPI